LATAKADNWLAAACATKLSETVSRLTEVVVRST